MPRRLFLSSAMVLALAGCATHYDVRTDFDPEAKFAAFHSYAYPERVKPDTPDILDNSLVRKRLQALFDRHLRGRGLAPAPDLAQADLLVRYWITTKERTDISTVPGGPPFIGPPRHPFWGGRWGPMYEDVVVHNYTQGTLVLDLVDARRNELVWRAYVVGTLNSDQDAAYAALDEALAIAFADYPPRGRAPR